MNLPNKLTALRILLIPVFIVFVSVSAIPYNYLWAAIIFAAASFTDFLDGYIARKNNLVTDFGKFADPLADKILTTTAFIYMMIDTACPPVVLVLILTREFAVSGVRMVAAGAKESKVIAANIWGKIKTVLQMVTIVLYYVLMAQSQLLAKPIVDAGTILVITNVLCWLVALVTIVSGFQYIWTSRSLINTAK